MMQFCIQTNPHTDRKTTDVVALNPPVVAADQAILPLTNTPLLLVMGVQAHQRVAPVEVIRHPSVAPGLNPAKEGKQ